MGCFLGKVVDNIDREGGDRVKVRIKNVDRYKKDYAIPYAFPLLPKILNIKPKIGEEVIVMCENDDPGKQRYFIGPLISQKHRMYRQTDDFAIESMLNMSMGKPDIPISDKPKGDGSFCDDEDVAIIGRKNTDIILSDDDIRIRCGARITDGGYGNVTTEFNREDPAYMKLHYDSKGLTARNPVGGEEENVKSTATLVAQKINLISTNGTPYVSAVSPDEKGISDKDMKELLEKAHALPYGDTLVEFLQLFIKAFIGHTHRYSQLPPVMDMNCTSLLKYEMNDMLSKDIKIN